MPLKHYLGFGAAGALAIGFIIVAQYLRDLDSARPAPPVKTFSVSRDVMIGEWEDTIGSWKQRIRIFQYAGVLLREIRLPDGRVDRDILSEVTPQASEERRFENPSSQHGREYAITQHGHLAIYDDDGFVGLAINTDRKGTSQ